jgi:hypothetical protein
MYVFALPIMQTSSTASSAATDGHRLHEVHSAQVVYISHSLNVHIEADSA